MPSPAPGPLPPVGLLGGTFNPVHEGHLSIAREALRLFDLDAVWFIPCAAPPHKPTAPLAPNADRLAMLRLALAGDSPFRFVYGLRRPQLLADIAERTEDTIEQYYDIVEDLDVPTSSKNYSSWKDIIALYDDLDHRIDAICDAWEISLKYAKPADHKNEIVAPLSRDNVAGTNDNKYRLDFEERYPGAKPVEVN